MLGIITLVFPENGIHLNKDLALNFPTFNKLFLEKKEVKKDISAIIALADAEDKATENVVAKENDTTTGHSEPILADIDIKDSAVKLNTSIQYKNASKTAL